MKTSVIITTVICIALLEGWALYLGHNGLILTSVIAVLAALAGLAAPTPKILK